jgi:hypothetical protein
MPAGFEGAVPPTLEATLAGSMVPWGPVTAELGEVFCESSAAVRHVSPTPQEMLGRPTQIGPTRAAQPIQAPLEPVLPTQIGYPHNTVAATQVHILDSAERTAARISGDLPDPDLAPPPDTQVEWWLNSSRSATPSNSETAQGAASLHCTSPPATGQESRGGEDGQPKQAPPTASLGEGPHPDLEAEDGGVRVRQGTAGSDKLAGVVQQKSGSSSSGQGLRGQTPIDQRVSLPAVLRDVLGADDDDSVWLPPEVASQVSCPSFPAPS